MGFTVLINSLSGTVSGIGPEKLEADLRAALGPELDALSLLTPQDFPAALDRVDSGSRLLIGGGDGTIRTAAARLQKRRVPFGVLPLGTMNLFAKDLGLPDDPVEAARLYRNSRTIRIDTGSVNGELFLCNAMVGLPSELAQERERQRSRETLAKWLTLMGQGFRKLASGRWFPLTVDCSDRLECKKIKAAIISNNEYEDFGGLGVFRKKSLTDGKLSIYTVSPEGTMETIALLSRLALGSWTTAAGVDFFNTRALTLHMRYRRLGVLLDGELHHMRSPLHFASDPASLEILVPEAVQSEATEEKGHAAVASL